MNQKLSSFFSLQFTIRTLFIIAAPLLVGSAIFYLVYSQSFLTLGRVSNPIAEIYPLVQSSDLQPLLAQAAQANFVLLGESSHGTSEYYLWRAEISRRLIMDHDFSFLVVEGDWEALYRLNLYIHQVEDQPGGARAIMANFDRWPTWMWANEEFLSFVEWIKEYNAGQLPAQRVSLYGKDIYGSHHSMLEIITYLNGLDRDKAQSVAELYACWLKYDNDFQSYLHEILESGQSCQADIAAAALIVENLDANLNLHDAKSASDYFNAVQNTRVVIHAEEHYRQNLNPGPGAWNARVRGMKDLFSRLLHFHGLETKAIIWAHNTHVGDARATSMTESGLINIGQLLREKYGLDKVFIIGLGSDRGTVRAGLNWGEEGRVMIMPPAQLGSLEDILSQQSDSDFIILFDQNKGPSFFTEILGHRAKGVVYNPSYDQGHYVPTRPADRYDAFIFFHRTSALQAL